MKSLPFHWGEACLNCVHIWVYFQSVLLWCVNYSIWSCCSRSDLERGPLHSKSTRDPKTGSKREHLLNREKQSFIEVKYRTQPISKFFLQILHLSYLQKWLEFNWIWRVKLTRAEKQNAGCVCHSLVLFAVVSIAVNIIVNSYKPFQNSSAWELSLGFLLSR